MTAKALYAVFLKLFPWMADEVEQFKTNCKDGGIDIYLETGEVLNFSMSKNTWVLKGGN